MGTHFVSHNLEKEESAQMKEILEWSKTDKRMAYPSVIADMREEEINRDQLKQARLLDEANQKIMESEATNASSSRTSLLPQRTNLLSLGDNQR